MPYQPGNRLTSTEQASKLGHLEVIGSPFVKSLVDQFEYPEVAEPTDLEGWQQFDSTGVEPLSLVIAVDGSFQVVMSDGFPIRSLAFVKTALVRLDRRRIEKIDKDMPHPVHMKALMSESAMQASTVLPLRNVRVPGTSNYELVRNIVRDSLRIEAGGLAYETLKWIVYRKWIPQEKASSPAFRCPYCPNDCSGLSYDLDEGSCEHCGNLVFVTDVIGFHLDMGEDQAPESLASSYMLVHEMLLLFSIVRHFWTRNDKKTLSNVLLIKDGPLSLRGQYSKLVDNLRAFLSHAKSEGCIVHMIGQEKTGAFVDHLNEVSRFVDPRRRDQPSSFAVLSHRYIREEIHHAPERVNPYGLKTNYGEKVLVKLDPYVSLALSIPVGEYVADEDFPASIGDFIGIERILATLPSLVSHQHEGALIPIALANGVASLSSYPSAAVLKLFAGL